MTVSVPVWAVIGVLWLALFGVVFCWRWIRDAAADALAWWRDRREPLADEEESGCECCEDVDAGYEGGSVCAQCGHPAGWHVPVEELPPERSREELGFTGPPPLLKPLIDAGLYNWMHDEARERRAPWWEAEHRAAYESLGFDYPSGLMARVREAAP